MLIKTQTRMSIVASWQAFYPEYEKAHSDPINKMLHFAGASFLILSLLPAILLSSILPVIPGVVIAYLLPHIGHRRFEGNNSFAVTRPLFCIAGALLLYIRLWRILLQRIFVH
jgi:hypothetical protein